MNGKELITLHFAKDQVTITEIIENLGKMIEEIRNECNKWRLTMNMNKTKYLCTWEDISDLKIENNERVEDYEQYRYLGIVTENNFRDNAEIKYRISQRGKLSRYWVVFGGMKRLPET